MLSHCFQVFRRLNHKIHAKVPDFICSYTQNRYKNRWIQYSKNSPQSWINFITQNFLLKWIKLISFTALNAYIDYQIEPYKLFGDQFLTLILKFKLLTIRILISSYFLYWQFLFLFMTNLNFPVGIPMCPCLRNAG